MSDNLGEVVERHSPLEYIFSPIGGSSHHKLFLNYKPFLQPAWYLKTTYNTLDFTLSVD